MHSIECVQNVKGMENLTSCAFFPVIRIAHNRSNKKKKNLICNKTLSSPAALVRQSVLLFFHFSLPFPDAKYRLFHIFLLLLLPLLRFLFLFRVLFRGRCRREREREKEKKSVISNFLIVIVFVLYCCPLWLFL
jgi:O-antigen/teichoic acid export membrane protein